MGMQQSIPSAAGKDNLTSQRPTWSSDDQPSCSSCSRNFSLIRRRHHCRACGQLFCDACCDSTRRLPQLGYYSKVRVCSGCCTSLRQVSNTKIPNVSAPNKRRAQARKTVRFCTEERLSQPYLDWVASNSGDDMCPCEVPADTSNDRRHRMSESLSCHSFSSESTAGSVFEIASSSGSFASDSSFGEDRASEVEHVACTQVIKACWEETLGQRGIDIEANFFKIGGHSVHAMKVVAALSITLSAPISVQHLYEYPTIKELASTVCSNSKISKESEELSMIISFDSDYVHPKDERASSNQMDAYDMRNHAACTQLIKACWEETLGQRGIDIEANFFKIGGHSAHAMKVVAALSITLSAPISVQHLYEYPTIKELASTVCSDLWMLHDPIAQIETTSDDKVCSKVVEESGWCDSCFEEYTISQMHVTRNGVKCGACIC